jgi:DNA-binding response OmpR family regulator
VLVVDGDDDTLALYALALSAQGFNVMPSRDGEGARRLAAANPPDIVVTEVSLPSDDGWSVVRALKSTPRTANVPIVVMTARTQAEVCERARREGCAAVVMKPCLPDRLALGLRTLLARKAGGPEGPGGPGRR